MLEVCANSLLTNWNLYHTDTYTHTDTHTYKVAAPCRWNGEECEHVFTVWRTGGQTVANCSESSGGFHSLYFTSPIFLASVS